MSTIPILIGHETAVPPRLVRFLPRFVGRESERRMLTIIPAIHAWLTKPGGSNELVRLKASTRAHFGQFVKGEPIDDCYYMKRVEDRRPSKGLFSHEVWSITPRFGNPQYRYFGTFVTLDWLLVCSKQSRDVLDEHENRVA